MRWCLAALAIAVLAGCTVTDPRPVYHPATATEDGRRMLVVGVERDLQNQPTVGGLARELAFAPSQRGRSAVEVGSFLDATEAASRSPCARGSRRALPTPTSWDGCGRSTCAR